MGKIAVSTNQKNKKTKKQTNLEFSFTLPKVEK